MKNHEDILRRALRGLEEDFEELRDELPRQLLDYEDGLRRLTRELPVWLEFPYSRVQSVLRFPESSTFRGLLIGPRAVAQAAGEIEGFVVNWIGESRALRQHGSTEQWATTKPWRRDSATLKRYMDTLEKETEAVSLAARTTMQHIRDEILQELEEQRKVDTDALSELIANGDVYQGQAARKEMADLWEDQRRRADSFTRRWDTLEHHIQRGQDMTESGLDALRDVLENAEYALDQAYASLGESSSFVDTPQDARSSSDELVVLSEPQEERPAGGFDDFDPYGDPSEAEVEAPNALAQLIAPPEEARSARQPQRRLNENFLAEPQETNDDLVYVDDKLEGPMIDFFAEEEQPSGAAGLFDSHIEEPPLAAHSADSPYDFFLPDAELGKRPHQDPLRAPSTRKQALDPTPAPTHTPATRATSQPAPRTVTEPAPRREPVAPTKRPATAPPVLTEAAPTLPPTTPASPEQPTAQARPTEPMSSTTREEEAYVDTPTFVPGALEAPAGPASVHDHSAELDTLELARADVDDVSSHTVPIEEHDVVVAAADISEVPAPTLPTLPTGPAEELPSDAGPTQPLIEPEPEPAPAPEPAHARAPEDPPKRRDEPQEEEDSTAPPSPSTRGSALRERDVMTKVPLWEFCLAYMVPIGAIAGLIVQQIVSALGFALLAWLIVAPLLLKWRMAWIKNMPALVRRSRQRDDAELVLESDRLEIGPWEIQRRDITEVSRAKWVSLDDQTRGWTLNIRTKNKRVWALEVPTSDPKAWERASLPITRPSKEHWCMKDEDAFETIASWSEQAVR